MLISFSNWEFLIALVARMGWKIESIVRRLRYYRNLGTIPGTGIQLMEFGALRHTSPHGKKPVSLTLCNICEMR